MYQVLTIGFACALVMLAGCLLVGYLALFCLLVVYCFTACFLSTIVRDQ